MRIAIVILMLSAMSLPMPATASTCHLLADYAEALMQQHQFPEQRGGLDVYASARRLRDPQLMDVVDQLQRLVWTHDRAVTEEGRVKIVHSFSQDIYNRCVTQD